MAEVIRMRLPLDREEVQRLRVDQHVLLSGKMLTARDAAHKQLHELLLAGKELPITLRNECVFYVGPTPAPPGRPLGVIGPTTSSRMDKYAPLLLDKGLLGMVGKGLRSPEVKEAIVRNGAVYFGAIAGACALLSKCVRSAEVIAYENLGTEAIRVIEVEDFPAFVLIDSTGADLYELAAREYQQVPQMASPGPGQAPGTRCCL